MQTLASLDDLLAMDGVMAAGEFTSDAKLTDFRSRGEMTPEMAAMSAQFCGSVTILFDTLAGAFSHMSAMPWTPQHGWSYSGGDWTVAVGGNRGVFVETAKADFNRLFEALIGPR